MALTKTTKLQAINTMLSVVGEPPVNSLTTQRADSFIAQNILDEVSREVLTYGWQFNTEDNVTLSPDSSTGFIYISDSVVRVDMDPRHDDIYDIVVRGNRIYNRKTNSFVFTEELIAQRVILMDFEDLPEVAKRYITIRAARIFQDRVVGAQTLHAFTATDELVALTKMQEYENEVGDYSIFQSDDMIRPFLRKGSYRVI
jgi:hypothetical protein